LPTGRSGCDQVRTESQERQVYPAELLKFLGSPELSGWWHINSGYVPIVEAAREEPEVVALHEEDPNFTVAIEQLENAQTVAPVNWFQSGVTALEQALSSITGDDGDVPSAIDTLREEYADVLDDNRQDLEALGIS